MEIRNVLAQTTVRDQDAAERWYSMLFGRTPDARPMDGLLEWRLGDAMGVAGLGGARCVLDVRALCSPWATSTRPRSNSSRRASPDATPAEATSSRILPVEDPDGNRIVFAGT